MNRFAILAVLLLSVLGQSVSARVVSADEAAQIAAQFCGSKMLKSQQKKAASADRLSLAYAPDNQSYYVFNRGMAGGYVIVGGNDCAHEILGFADEGTFDFSNMSPAMKQWLDGCSREIAYASAHPSVVASSAPSVRKAKETKLTINPLITAKWGQKSPYYLYCPEIEGKKCLTGCGATAISMIVHHYKWPEQGRGSYSYNWSGYGTLSRNFTQSHYDWANMTDTYSDASTAAQNEAVARLMADVGIGMTMHYGTTESGSKPGSAVGVLVNNLGYDKGMRHLIRRFYSTTQWTDLIYSEIAEGRPVFMTGDDGSSGHAFVCDGYRSDGFFHFNWGWNGVSDGYFALTPLKVNSDDFSCNNTALIGIKPDKEGTSERTLSFATYGDVNIRSYNDNYVEVNYTKPLFSYTQGENSIQHCLIVEKVADGSSYYADATSGPYYTVLSFDSYTLSNSFSVYVYKNRLPMNGKYKLYPGIRLSNGDDCVKVSFPRGLNDHVNVEFVNGQMNILPDDEATPITFSARNFSSETWRMGAKFLATVNLTCAGSDYEGELQLMLGNGDALTKVASANVSLGENCEDKVSFSETLSGVTEGTYDVYLCDANGNKLIANPLGSIEVLPAITGTPSLTGSGVKIEGYLNSLTCDFDLKCTGGYFAGEVTMQVFVYEPYFHEITSIKQFITLNDGETKRIHFEGDMMGETVGKTYRCQFLVNGNLLSLSPSFVLQGEKKEAAKVLKVNGVSLKRSSATSANAARRANSTALDVVASLYAENGYAGNVKLSVMDAGNNVVAEHYTGLLMDKDETYDMTFTTNDLEPNIIYKVVVNDGTENGLNVIDGRSTDAKPYEASISLGNALGIEFTGDGECQGVQVFTISGVKLLEGNSASILDNLQPGIYVVKRIFSRGITVEKVIK